MSPISSRSAPVKSSLRVTMSRPGTKLSKTHRFADQVGWIVLPGYQRNYDIIAEIRDPPCLRDGHAEWCSNVNAAQEIGSELRQAYVNCMASVAVVTEAADNAVTVRSNEGTHGIRCENCVPTTACLAVVFAGGLGRSPWWLDAAQPLR